MSNCDLNVFQGKDILVLVRNPDDTQWWIVGGATSTTRETTNPSTNVTSQSTVGDNVERQGTGYSDTSLSIEGKMDKRSGEVRTYGGVEYVIAPASYLDKLANTGQRCGKFKLLSSTVDLESVFHIAAYSVTSELEGVVEYSTSLEILSTPTWTWK